ncbi:hypothetical protein [Staphylococcus saccharolyticus]|uniref:hypothetical protein n=1 Tax=Staphylococcus saccharolyticus TaxID=33028 RepID=UPI0032DF35CE
MTLTLYDEATDIIFEQLYAGMQAQIQFETKHGFKFNVDVDVLANFITGGNIKNDLFLDPRWSRLFNR